MQKRDFAVNASALVDAFGDLPVWLLWKKEPGKGGKIDKRPYAATRSGHAGANDKTARADFQTAAARFAASPGFYDGIGLAASTEHEIICVDVDHCIDAETGEMSPLADEVLEAFEGQYIERSQSGTGLHVVTRGMIPRSFNNSTAGFEMYADAHFLALTADVLCNGEPGYCEAVNRLFGQYAPPEIEASAPTYEEGEPQFSDEEIIEHAMKRGIFPLLWKGDYEEAGYGSRSEADIALCLSLAFWGERNEEVIDRLFRRSGLYREKWERDDYRQYTIRKACGKLKRSYGEWLREEQKKDFETEVADDPEAVNVLARIQTLDPIHMDGFRCDDIGFAKLFAAVFERRLKYNADAQRWMSFDGRRWQKDCKDGLHAKSCAKLFQRALLRYAADQDNEAFQKAVSKLAGASPRVSLLKDSQDRMPCRYEDFDRDPYLFNCPNGVLDLRTFVLQKHDPDLMLSKLAGADYDPEADTAMFDRFVHEIMQDDNGMVEYLQTLFGYALIGESEREELYILHGATTRNGKSTLLETLCAAFGDYAANIQPESLAQQDRRGSGVSGDIARLDGVRLLHCAEPKKHMRLDVALIKQLTGRDKVTARELYESEREFVPVFTLFMNANHLPVVNDDTLFRSGRVKVIPFDRHFDEAEQDQGLKTRLLRAENLAAALVWCVKGLQRYTECRGKISLPVKVQTATDAYRLSSDKLQNFINDCLEPDMLGAITAKDFYAAYSSWCVQNHHGTESKGQIMQLLRERNLLSDTATVNGKTLRNVIKGYTLPDESRQFTVDFDDDIEL